MNFTCKGVVGGKRQEFKREKNQSNFERQSASWTFANNIANLPALIENDVKQEGRA